MPTDAGAGSRLQPGPGPIGPGPGPCAKLGSPVVVASAISKGFLRSIVPWNDFRGVRSRGESCAKAVIAIVIASAEAMLREISRTFRFLQFKRNSPLCQKWAATSSATVCLDARPLYRSLGALESYAVLTRRDRRILSRRFLELREYFVETAAFNITQSDHAIPRPANQWPTLRKR